MSYLEDGEIKAGQSVRKNLQYMNLALLEIEK